MTTHRELAEVLDRLRLDLVEEATPLPGQQLAYGRPHEHPRTRSFKHYSKSGQRIEGETRIGPDCPRPVRGRCECPPDGSWRPAVGVIRADSTATHAVQVPADRLRPALEGVFWVADVYVQEPDGLWHCRWPTRAALERLRGVSPRRWAVAVGLLRGDHVTAVWGAMGVPPNPIAEAFRIVRQLEAWAAEERTGEWERRPRQWWDPPKKARASNDRPVSISESQAIAEHVPDVTDGLHVATGAATLAAETEALDEPRSVSGPGPRSEPPTDEGARTLPGTPIPHDEVHRRCA
jgi:hypothetical protein